MYHKTSSMIYSNLCNKSLGFISVPPISSYDKTLENPYRSIRLKFLNTPSTTSFESFQVLWDSTEIWHGKITSLDPFQCINTPSWHHITIRTVSLFFLHLSVDVLRTASLIDVSKTFQVLTSSGAFFSYFLLPANIISPGLVRTGTGLVRLKVALVRTGPKLDKFYQFL